MSGVPQIGAGQDGDDRGAHLWTKQLFAANPADTRQRETRPGPERGGEHVERDGYDKYGLHDMTPGDVDIGYTICISKLPEESSARNAEASLCQFGSGGGGG
jgi:hypothetical protein